MIVFKQCLRFLSLLSVLLVVSLTASAQYRAGIHGTILDPQGAAVADAKVTVTAVETGLTQETTSDESGVYSINRLAPGSYTVTVEKTGFKKKVFDDFRVLAEQVNPLDVTLDVGQVTESVTVSGSDLPAIDTESGTISGTVTAQQIQQLPSFGRDTFQLLQLAPGVFGDGSQQAGGGTQSQPGNQGPGGSCATCGVFATENRPQISANGGRQDMNNVSLDGIGITSVTWGGAAVITPNEDSVKEVRIVSNEYDAESGRFGAAQTQVISQSGTNSYHGSFFYKWDRPYWNAYQSFRGSNDMSYTPQRNNSNFNQWGGSAGGPILKNRLFVFFAYERISNSALSTSQGWYPTASLLQSAPTGSLASRYAAYPGELPVAQSQNDYTCASVGLIDAATAAQLVAHNAVYNYTDAVSGDKVTAPFTGGASVANCAQIPGQGLNVGTPLNSALGTHDPSANVVISGGNTIHPQANTVTTVVDPVTKQTYYVPGLGGDGSGLATNLGTTANLAYINTSGHTTNLNQQYMGRIDFNLTKKDLLAFNIYYTPVNNTGFNGPMAYPANAFNHNAINEAMTLLWNHTFTPTLINEARVNAAGWRWNELTDNPNTPLGLPPTMYIGDPNNGNNIGTICGGCNGPGAPAGSVFDQWTYGYKDVMTKVQGSQTLKFGGEITELHFVQEAPWSARPSWGFNNYWDFLNDAPSKENGVFDPQTGVPTDVRKDSRQTLYGLFLQDNWKLKPNFTLTLGIRWEYFGSISFTRNQLSTVVFGSGQDALTGMSMRIGGNLYTPGHNNFGPQVGFAWSPNGLGSHAFNNKLVIRGGFGIGYTGLEQAISLNGWPNIPFTNNGVDLTGSSIVYDFPTDPLQFSPYPENPNTILTFNSNNIPVTGSKVGVTAFPADFPTPYTLRYSLEGQYDIGHNWIATAGYTGSSSRHLTQQYNYNSFLGAMGIPLNPMVNNVDYYGQDANASYNALLLQIQHRFSQNFQIDGSYRYSHGYDNASGPYTVSYYQWNPKLNWGPSDFDVTDAFKVWGIYTPNFFKEGWKKSVLGGWSISGIFNWHSGFPWSAVYNTGTCDIIYAGGNCQNGTNGQLLPVAYLGGATSDFSNSAFIRAGGNFQNGGGTYFTQPTVTSCNLPFPQTCPAPPEAPGMGRNAFRGPRYVDLDATVSKAFALPKMPFLGENAQFEFRANFYNLFNNTNLTSIVNTITDAHFGQASGALGSRTIEMQARFSF